MLRTDLIDIINKGGVWVFVGSGPSIDSGCPKWSELILNIVDKNEEILKTKILEDSIYQESIKIKDYAKCFSRIEKIIGREKLNLFVKKEIDITTHPGKILGLLAEWPFCGYITSNYDNLIETSLEKSGQLGWSSVGNSNHEVRKISRDVSNVVWHIHGSTKLSEDRSKLVLTEEDYDEIYLNDTFIKSQLKSLLSQHHLVLIGFGFNDIEIKRILKLVGKCTNPARPIIAFIEGLDSPANFEKRKELLEQYNIDVIPYQVGFITLSSYAGLLNLGDPKGLVHLTSPKQQVCLFIMNYV
jgi:hypothetical protein